MNYLAKKDKFLFKKIQTANHNVKLYSSKILSFSINNSSE